MKPTKADIYRKAAEVIVRDGKTEAVLFEGADGELEVDTEVEMHVASGRPVCAIGACVRAEYELTGTLDEQTKFDPYNQYRFLVDRPEGLPGYSGHRDDGRWVIWIANDYNKGAFSAEDIALMLKRQAEEIDTP